MYNKEASLLIDNLFQAGIASIGTADEVAFQQISDALERITPERVTTIEPTVLTRVQNGLFVILKNNPFHPSGGLFNLESAAMAYLNVQNGIGWPDQIDPQILLALGKSLPLSSRFMLGHLQGFNPAVTYPSIVSQAIVDANTISPQATYFDDQDKFNDKFHSGDIYLFDRNTFQGEDFDRVHAVGTTGSLETGTDYLSGFNRSIYLVGSEKRIGDSKKQKTVLYQARLASQKDPKPNLFSHIHPLLLGFYPSSGDTGSAREDEAANLGSISFLGSFRRDTNHQPELAYIQYNSYGPIVDTLSRKPYVISTSQYAQRFNQFVASQQ